MFERYLQCFVPPSNEYFENMEREASAEAGNKKRERAARHEEVVLVNSKRKGNRAEVELSQFLTEALGIPCRRGQQYSGIEGDDVVGVPGVHIECKRCEKTHIRKWWAQAVKDAAQNGNVPIVCHRSNAEPWMVTTSIDHLVDLALIIAQVARDRGTFKPGEDR